MHMLLCIAEERILAPVLPQALHKHNPVNHKDKIITLSPAMEEDEVIFIRGRKVLYSIIQTYSKMAACTLIQYDRKMTACIRPVHMQIRIGYETSYFKNIK